MYKSPENIADEIVTACYSSGMAKALLRMEIAAAIQAERNLLIRALPFLDDHRDEGPWGEQWQSDELMKLCDEIRARTKGER